MIDGATLRRFQRVRLTLFAILALSFMLVFFHRIAPGVVAADLMREFSTTAAALGSLAAMYFYIRRRSAVVARDRRQGAARTECPTLAARP